MTKSQTQQILQWLKEGKSLTPLDALREFGCLRLSGRIYDIRHGVGCEPHPVKTTYTHYGNKTFATYELDKEEMYD